MVQILVQVRIGPRAAAEAHFEMLECELDTTVRSIKQQVAAAGEASGKYTLPPSDQELVFMGERCQDDQTLRNYGVCEPWIVQVAGFTVNPEQPGKRFEDGVLVPCEG